MEPEEEHEERLYKVLVVGGTLLRIAPLACLAYREFLTISCRSRLRQDKHHSQIRVQCVFGQIPRDGMCITHAACSTSAVFRPVCYVRFLGAFADRRRFRVEDGQVGR